MTVRPQAACSSPSACSSPRCSPRAIRRSAEETVRCAVATTTVRPSDGAPDYGVAGTSTRLMVWMTPLVAWMLIPESSRRGSRSAGVSSRRKRPRGRTVPPLAIVSGPANSTCSGEQLLAGDHVVEQHVADLVDREGGEDRVERRLLARRVAAAEVGHEPLEGAVVRREDGERLRLVGERRRQPGRGDGGDQQVVVVRVVVGTVGARRLDGHVDDRTGRRMVPPARLGLRARGGAREQQATGDRDEEKTAHEAPFVEVCGDYEPQRRTRLALGAQTLAAANRGACPARRRCVHPTGGTTT